MAPKNNVGKVEYKQNLAGNVWLVRINLNEVAEFIPGQYVSIKVSAEGLRRSYSVASLPGQRNVDLLIDVTPMGVGSKYILSLNVGDPVELLGFLGHFTIDQNLLQNNNKVLFVATGTGIAPFKPMVEDLLVNKQYKGEVRLVWGMRFEEDLYWLKEMENIHRDYDNLHFDLVLSKPKPEWPGLSGHVGDVIEKLVITGETTLAYLCGAPAMIDEINTMLNKKGIPEEKIFFEKYS